MSLFMDMPTIEREVSGADVAQAHQADLETQSKCGVSYLRYWVDEEAGRSSVLSKPMTQRPQTPFTERHMGWLPTRSSLSASTAETTQLQGAA